MLDGVSNDSRGPLAESCSPRGPRPFATHWTKKKREVKNQAGKKNRQLSQRNQFGGLKKLSDVEFTGDVAGWLRETLDEHHHR